MARNLGTVKQTQMAKVTCIDNGKTIDAEVISTYPDRVVVELPGGLRLTMRRHAVHKDTYIAAHSGMEFQCKIK